MICDVSSITLPWVVGGGGVMEMKPARRIQVLVELTNITMAFTPLHPFEKIVSSIQTNDLIGENTYQWGDETSQKQSCMCEGFK